MSFCVVSGVAPDMGSGAASGVVLVVDWVGAGVGSAAVDVWAYDADGKKRTCSSMSEPRNVRFMISLQFFIVVSPLRLMYQGAGQGELAKISLPEAIRATT